MYFIVTINMDNFCIKSGYIIRVNNDYYTDYPHVDGHQPDVYKLAYYLAKKDKINHIVDIGSGNANKHVPYKDEGINLILIDHGNNLNNINSKLKNVITRIDIDLEKIDKDMEFDLTNSIVILADVIEHIVDPDPLLNYLSKISKECKYLLISTPDRERNWGVNHMGPPPNGAHCREWTLKEFSNLLEAYGISNYLLGFTIDNSIKKQKKTILAICGISLQNLGLLDNINTENLVEEIMKI